VNHVQRGIGNPIASEASQAGSYGTSGGFRP